MIESNSSVLACSAANLVNLVDSICFGLKYRFSHVNVVLKKNAAACLGASCLSSGCHSAAIFQVLRS